MSWIIPSITATLTGTLALTIVCGYLYHQYRERFMGLWALSWILYTVRFIFELLLNVTDKYIAILVCHQLANLFSGLLFLGGIYAFLGKRLPRWMMAGAVVNAFWIAVAISTRVNWLYLNLPTFLIIGLFFVWAGIAFIRSQELKGMGKNFAGWAFILWGLHKINYPFLKLIPWFAPWGYLFAALLEFMVASGTLIVYFQRVRKNLTASEERFRRLAENAQDVVYRYRIGTEPGFDYVSPSVTRITGFTPEEHYANPNLLFQVIDADIQKPLEFDISCVDDAKGPYQLKWCRKDGRTVWTEISNVFIRNENGQVVAAEGIARDITERKKVEAALVRYRLLSEHASDLILFLRTDGKILSANEAFTRSYGFSKDELTNMTIFELRAPDYHSSLAEQLKQAETKSMLFETYHRKKDGTVFPVEVSLQGTLFENENVLFAIVRDISDRKRAEETINHMAYHDPLTDLPNRMLFYDRLKVALAQAHRNGDKLAVMFLDLDRFKYVNDIMGHAQGDLLLKEVAGLLTASVRANDTVARIGGDEFTILLPEVNSDRDAAKVAEKIISVLKIPWEINGYEFPITASVGIVLYPNDGEDADTLTKNADTAMYRAKEQGDNYQFYTPAMNLKAVERVEMERAIRTALEADEFEIYYQPQVSLKTGQVIGLEALLRWNHPERGLLTPGDFIAVAEDTGVIVPLGEWVLRTACRQNVEWLQHGLPPMRMAVNISAYQFRQKNFVDTVAGVLEETGMDPTLLELEITESTAMQNMEFSVAMLQRLKDMGIHIAIDDFGTGYSSLSYLRRFPINTLKVDKSFVRDVLSNVEDAAIVATIIVLAQNLRLKIIVEGIETREQMIFFRQQECYNMQGFFFSKPVPAPLVEEFIRQLPAYDEKGSIYPNALLG